MRKILITLFILTNSVIGYCQHKFTQSLNSVAEVVFPDTPEVEFSNGATYYSYRDNQNDIYFAQVIDLKTISPGSFDPKLPDDIYNQFIRSAIDPLKGEVFYNSNIEIGGFKGVAFDYKCELKGNTYYGYQEVFHLNDDLLSYSLFTPDSLARDDKKIRSFFTTFKLTPVKAKAANKRASMMAGIFMISAIFFWIMVAVFIYKKVTRKKQHKWTDKEWK